MPVRAAVVAAAATFSFFVPTPAKAANVQTYDVQIVKRTFVSPDPVLSFKPQVQAGAAFHAGSDTYTNQINFQTIVGPQDVSASYQAPAAYLSAYAGGLNASQVINTCVLYQSNFPANFKPAGAAQPNTQFGYQSYDNLVINKTFVGPQDGQELFKPATAQPKYGYQSYDNLVVNKTFVGPQDGQELFKPSPPTGVAGFTSATIEQPFIVADPTPGTLFKPQAAAPIPYKPGSDTYNNQVNFQTIIRPELGQALFKPPPQPTGFQTYDNQVNFRPFQPAQDGQALYKPFIQPTPGLFYPPDQLVLSRKSFTDNFPYTAQRFAGQTQLPTGFGSWDNYFFPQPSPAGVHIEISPHIPAIPSIPQTGIPSGDGPPWHLTQKEIKRLLHYREELARIQQAYDARRRSEVDDVLREVNAAAGRVQFEPETVGEFIQPIEAKIRALSPPKKSLYSLDLKALKKTIDENAAQRELEEDDQIAMMLIKEFFS